MAGFTTASKSASRSSLHVWTKARLEGKVRRRRGTDDDATAVPALRENWLPVATVVRAARARLDTRATHYYYDSLPPADTSVYRVAAKSK